MTLVWMLTLLLCLTVSHGVAQDAATLHKSKNCATCHAIDRKMAGPSYQEIAKRYADDPQAPEVLAASIVQGVKGKFGPMPMPATPAISGEEVTALVKWILAQQSQE